MSLTIKSKKMKKNITSIKKAFLPAFLFAALLFSSCSKNELDDVQVSNDQAAKEGITNTTSGSNDAAGENVTANINTPNPVIPINAMIYISHGPCMGACPTYTLTLSNEGEVIYTGMQNVATKGVVRYFVGPEVAYRLGSLMVTEGFFNFDDQYLVIPDAPRYETVLVWNGKTKRVIDCGIQVPPELVSLRQKVEDVLNISRYTDPQGIAQSSENIR